MISKQEIVSTLLQNALFDLKSCGRSFAPSNIALVKYWGKRQSELNLPQTASMSLSLSCGTHTTVSLNDTRDSVTFNGVLLAPHDPKAVRALSFCNLFRPLDKYFVIETKNDIPTGAGLASSASGFAALTLALDDLFGWKLDKRSLSILARLGSGSASRSLYTGFVKWYEGVQDDGLDSFAEPFGTPWSELQLGVLLASAAEKPIDSRSAMQSTVATSPLYSSWKETVQRDLALVEEAITTRDFGLLGQTAESNALTMHATMMAAKPPIFYWLDKSVFYMHKIWKLRASGLPLYFTMDAGPNLKVLFLEKDKKTITSALPELQFLVP